MIVSPLRDAIAGLITCKTFEISWHGPFGAITLTVTDTKTYFNRYHVIDIALPPGTPFPLETLSYVATAMEVERTGGAARFVQGLIATAESTAAWRDYAARSVKAVPLDRGHQRPPPRPKPRAPPLEARHPKR